MLHNYKKRHMIVVGAHKNKNETVQYMEHRKKYVEHLTTIHLFVEQTRVQQMQCMHFQGHIKI